MSIVLGMTAGAEDTRPQVLVVIGAEGTPEYGAGFRRWADQWRAAAEQGGAGFTLIGRSEESDQADRVLLKEQIVVAQLRRAPLWLVLIGHGTDDGRDTRFNLRGPDVTAKELAEWLGPVKRPVAVIHCGSASGPFVNALSGPNRVVVTATRSGSESNYARFGEHMAGAIADPTADLDRDGQVSLLEAFLTASYRTAEFYRSEARLATEHALLDDNGDQLGSAADWFQGVRAVKRAKEGAQVDGTRAHQWHLIPSAAERQLPEAVRLRRDELELKVNELRDLKEKLTEDEYYRRLEPLMVELARIYRDSGKAPGEGK